jgi:hypothetical protein
MYYPGSLRYNKIYSLLSQPGWVFENEQRLCIKFSKGTHTVSVSEISHGHQSVP